MNGCATVPLKLDSGSGLVMPARHIPSPNCDERPVSTEIEVLVIHAISLPPGRYDGDYIEQLFTNRLPVHDHPYFDQIRDLRVSTHFLIRRTGALIQFVPTHLRAWHAGDSAFKGREKVNDFSLGIELEGCDEEPFEPIQYEVLTRLVRCLLDAYPRIAPSAIVGHCDISPGRKTDPGPNFDWAAFRRSIQKT